MTRSPGRSLKLQSAACTRNTNMPKRPCPCQPRCRRLPCPLPCCPPYCLLCPFRPRRPSLLRLPLHMPWLRLKPSGPQPCQYCLSVPIRHHHLLPIRPHLRRPPILLRHCRPLPLPRRRPSKSACRTLPLPPCCPPPPLRPHRDSVLRPLSPCLPQLRSRRPSQLHLSLPASCSPRRRPRIRLVPCQYCPLASCWLPPSRRRLRLSTSLSLRFQRSRPMPASLMRHRCSMLRQSPSRLRLHLCLRLSSPLMLLRHSCLSKSVCYMFLLPFRARIRFRPPLCQGPYMRPPALSCCPIPLRSCLLMLSSCHLRKPPSCQRQPRCPVPCHCRTRRLCCPTLHQPLSPRLSLLGPLCRCPVTLRFCARCLYLTTRGRCLTMMHFSCDGRENPRPLLSHVSQPSRLHHRLSPRTLCLCPAAPRSYDRHPCPTTCRC